MLFVIFCKYAKTF